MKFMVSIILLLMMAYSTLAAPSAAIELTPDLAGYRLGPHLSYVLAADNKKWNDPKSEISPVDNLRSFLLCSF
jgi:hypothetical protein